MYQFFYINNQPICEFVLFKSKKTIKQLLKKFGIQKLQISAEQRII
jgi:hypothetical protein